MPVGTARCCLGDVFAWRGGGLVFYGPLPGCLPVCGELLSDPNVKEVRGPGREVRAGGWGRGSGTDSERGGQGLLGVAPRRVRVGEASVAR